LARLRVVPQDGSEVRTAVERVSEKLGYSLRAMAEPEELTGAMPGWREQLRRHRRDLTTVVSGLLIAIAVAFAIALLWPVTRRYGLAFGLFVVANLLPALLVGGVVAVGRYTSVLFPLFLWLGERMPPRHAPYWFAIFGMGQGLAACLFFTWRQLF